MRNLFKYLIIHPLAALLLVVLMLLVLLAVLSTTQTGTGMIVQLAERALPALQLDGVKGTLLKQVEAGDLVWEDNGIRVEAEQARFGVGLGASLPPRLNVRELYAKQVRVQLPPSSDEYTGPIVLPDLRLPVDVDLANVALDELQIVQGETLVRLRGVKLNAYTRQGVLHLDELVGDLYDDSGAVTISGKGRMELNVPQPLELDVTLTGDGTTFGRGSLDVQARGKLQDYLLEAKGDWQYLEYPRYQLDLAGTGNFEGLDFGQLKLTGDSGDVSAKGKLVWSPELVWDVQLSAEGVRPEVFAPDVPGMLDVDLSSNGKLVAGKPVMQLELGKLQGSLRDYPLDATAKASLDGEVIKLETLDARVGENRLQARGEAENDVQINWELDAPDLEQLHPDINGHLKGKGRLSGKLDGSELALEMASLTGQVLDYPLDAVGDIALKDGLVRAKALKVDVGENHVELNGVADESAGIDWKIDAKKLSRLHPQLDGALKGSGNAQGLLDGSRFAVRVDELAGKVKGYPIQARGELRMQDQLLSAKGVKLDVGDNHMTLEGVADESTGIDWTLDAAQLSQLYPDLKGSLQGSGNAQGLLDGSRFAVKIETLDGKVQDFPVKASGQVSMQDQLLTARKLRVDVGDNHVGLDGIADENTGIDWTIDAKNLAQLSPELKGNLQGSGNAQGLLDGSRFAVKIKSLEGKVQDFPLKASGQVSMKDKLLAANKLLVEVGKNRVELNGVADENAGINWELDAKNLSQLNPGLKGNLQGRGNAQGLLDGSRFAVNIEALSGSVQGYPVKAHGRINMKDQLLSAKGVVVDVGVNHIELNGVADESAGIDWKIDAKNLSQLYPAIKGDLQGSGNAQGLLDGSRFAVSINSLQGTVQDYPITAKGVVRMQNQLLGAKNLQLSVGNNRIELNGVADEAKGINWTLDAKNLTQLHPQARGELRGNGVARGLLDGSRLAVSVASLEGRVQDFPLQASGEVRLNDKVLTARDLLVNVGQNRVRLNGSAGDKLGLNWELDAKNIAQIYPAIKGSVQGNGSLGGKIDGSQLDLVIARLQGQIEGRSLQASGKVRVQGQKIDLNNLVVLAGDNRIEANGQASEPLNLSWRINGRNLAQAWPGLAGSLQGEGTVRGSLKQPQVQGGLQGSQLVYQDIRLGKLEVQARQTGAQYDIRGKATNLVQGLNVVSSIDFSLLGALEKHTLTAAIAHKAGRLDVRASGGLRNEQWQGAIQSLSLRDTAAGDWQLTNAVGVSASAKAVSVANACLVNPQKARVCSQLNWAPSGGVVAKGVLQQVPLSMVRAFLPPGLQLPGMLNADYQFEQRGGRPFARVNLVLPDNALTYRPPKGRAENLQYTNARANITLDDRTAVVQAQLDIRGRGQLRADGRINLSPDNGQHRVDMRATLNVPDIAWAGVYAPQIDELKGKLSGDVRVNGLLSKPQITGVLRLVDGSLYLPETGASLEGINLTAQASQPEQMNITGSLRAGQGQLSANGVLRLKDLPNWSADLRVQGNNLLLMNTHEVQAWVSPDLAIKATPKSVVISGTVRVPETSISLRELPTGTNVRSDDIVIVSHGKQQGATGQTKRIIPARDTGASIDIQPNVLIELGDKVKINGFGLDARLTGKLRVLRNRQDIVAEGVLNVVDGAYKAYGQSLQIERGRLLFNGPIDNPGLDVRAVRVVEDGIKVGMSLSGSVQKPESTLFSTPQQTQTDTLSYLLTGHAISGVSGGESAILTQAITGLGVAGGESLAQTLGGQLGLDDVGLNTNGGDYRQSELSLGKRLGPRLYIKYIVGLFDSLQKVAVTYQINKRLQVEATSGLQQSVDLIYKLDTDTGPFGR